MKLWVMILLLTAWFLGIATHIVAERWVRYIRFRRLYTRGAPRAERLEEYMRYAEDVAFFGGCVGFVQRPMPGITDEEAVIVASEDLRWSLVVARDPLEHKPNWLDLNVGCMGYYQVLFTRTGGLKRQVLVSAPRPPREPPGPVTYLDKDGDGVFEEIRVGPAGSQTIYSFTGLGWSKVSKPVGIRPADSLPADK